MVLSGEQRHPSALRFKGNAQVSCFGFKPTGGVKIPAAAANRLA